MTVASFHAPRKFTVGLCLRFLGFAALVLPWSGLGYAQPLESVCSNPLQCTSGACESGRCCSLPDFVTRCDAGLGCEEGGTCCCGQAGATCGTDYRQSYPICCVAHGSSCANLYGQDPCCMTSTELANTPYECVRNNPTSQAGTCQRCQWDGYFLDAGIDAGASCCLNHSDKLVGSTMSVCCQPLGDFCDDPHAKCCDDFNTVDKTDGGVICAYTSFNPYSKSCCLPNGKVCSGDGGNNLCCSGNCCDGICQ
jgi:hypothetical protein